MSHGLRRSAILILLVLACVPLLGDPAAGQSEGTYTAAMLNQLFGLDTLPSPAALRFLAALSNPITIQQYLANEQAYLAGLAEMRTVYRRTYRAPTPVEWWQLAYHSAIVETNPSGSPEDRTALVRRHLDILRDLHRSRVSGATVTDGTSNTFMIGKAAVAVTGRFTRSSGGVENVILYHWANRNTVNWVLGQGEPRSLPFNTLPDPNV